MTDPIATLLRTEADRLSAGVVPPPVDALRPRRPGRWAAPLAAAAAVTVVAAGAVVAARQAPERPAAPLPITRVGDVVPYDRAATRPRPGDAPRPRAALGHDPDAFRGARMPTCTGAGMTGDLTLDGGTGRLRLRWIPQAGRSDCLLGDGVPVLRLLAADGTEVARARYAAQPAVVNPPVGDERSVTWDGLFAGLTWPSHCGAPPVRASLLDVADGVVPVTVTGTPPPCAGDGEQPELGLLGEYGIVPRDREGLTVSVEPSAKVRAGVATSLVLRLANPTARPISLTPCPTWFVEQREGLNGRSGTRSGRAPCDALPPSVAPGEAVRFAVEEAIGFRSPDMTGVRNVRVAFGIAGTAPWTAGVPADYGTPRPPVATVPWRDTPVPPGEPKEGAPPVGTAMPMSTLFPYITDLPESVAPGEVLRYTVHVANRSTTPFALDPCPGFVQWLSLDDDTVVDEHYLNCADAPSVIGAKQTVAFRMQLRVPPVAPEGPANLDWKLGKLDWTGSESTTARVLIRR